MKRILIAAAAIALLIGLMFAEYRIIMCNIKPYLGQGNTVYLEIFGIQDEYYAEDIE